jgi:fructose-1,6-bisphosphatase/inositol monophosphatase family enzyme
MDALSADTIKDSLATIQRVFREHRSLMLERAGKVTFDSKHDGSPVTETDVEIEKALQAVLAEQFPGLPVFGEETGYPSTFPPFFWVVDPIDGTKSFIENTPTFTCMAALIYQNDVIASVIYNPSTDDMFTARAGEGAYKNDVRIDLAKVPLPHIALCKRQFIDELNAMLASASVTCEVPPTGGGYGFTMVLSGLAAARFQMKGRGYIHDYAPGALLIDEAGGAILPILDPAYTYTTKSFVACHPELAPVIQPHISKLRQLELS